MFGLGMGELIVILLIVVVIFGASRLPQIGEGLGKAIRGFKKSLKEPDAIDVTPGKEKNNSKKTGDESSKS